MDNKPAKVQKDIMRMISAGASRRDLVRRFSKLTPERVLRGEFPSLALVKRQYGEEKTEKAVAILIADASLAFGDGFDSDTSLELAAEIQASYHYFSLEDCFLVLTQLKRQPTYGKLTLNKVLSAFEQYSRDRLNRAEEMSWNHHLAVKENPNSRDKDVSPLKSAYSPKRRSRK